MKKDQKEDENQRLRVTTATTVARRWNNRSAFAIAQQLSPANATIIFPFRRPAMSLVLLSIHSLFLLITVLDISG